MKLFTNSLLPFSVTVITFSICLSLILIPIRSLSQFQRCFGTNLDNLFSKVIRNGNNYYLLGQDEPTNSSLPHATVTRLDINGLWQWTTSLNVASILNDAVLTPSGELLVVGSTLPLDPNTKSLIGRITQSGSFAWLRSYDSPGQDKFTRIVKNPVPQNGAFPYYVLGAQNETTGTPTTDDVVLFNIDETGTINWKKIYNSVGDDEFFRDLEALPNGDLLLAGNAASGLIFMADNTGHIYNGAQVQLKYYTDVSQKVGGDFYAAANSFNNTEAYLSKFRQDLLLLWEVKIPELKTLSQVWEGLSGEIYAIGSGTFGGQVRTVIIKLLDNGPSVVWVKYLNAGSGFTDGSAWFLPPNDLAFIDARVISTGFGGKDAFLSISDLNLTICKTTNEMVTLVPMNPSPNGPILPSTSFFGIPMGVDLPYNPITWSESEVCKNGPCSSNFNFQSIGCGKFNFTGIAYGTSPFNYQWDFGDPASVPNNTSVLLNPIHQFSSSGSFIVTITVTDATGCTATYSAIVRVQSISAVNITANPSLSICQGQFTILTANASPGCTYIWNNSNNTQSIQVSNSDTYCVTCTDASGCTTTACVTVTVNPLPIVDAGTDKIICSGQSEMLTAIGNGGLAPYTYLWTPGGSSTNPFNTGVLQNTTTYTVVLIDAKGCSSADQVTVKVDPAPNANAGIDQSICNGQSVTLYALGGVMYKWSPNGSISNPNTVTPSMTTTYTVTVTGANNCTAIDQVIITVEPCCDPNNNLSFNGDFNSPGDPIIGFNDIWLASSWGGCWPFGASGTTHNGDFWKQGSILQPPCTFQHPKPSLQGKYAGFWCWFNPGSRPNRQGILNYTHSIKANTSCYNLSLKIACTCGPFGVQPVKLGIYGVRVGAISSVPTGPLSTLPPNTGLFWTPPVTFDEVDKLGLILLPHKSCDENFKTYNLQFNSIGFPKNIDRIFFTREDAWGGVAYLDVDDVCISPAICDVSCTCGSTYSESLSQTGTGFYYYPFNPGATGIHVPCSHVGRDIWFDGNFACGESNCLPSQISWILNGPGGLLHSGTSISTYPYFSIYLPWWYFQQGGGNYTITISRSCGSKICNHDYYFTVDECPCICSSTFYSNVSQGFVVTAPGPVTNCTRYLKPLALCPADAVTWSITGFGNVATSSGNNIQQINFPGPGWFRVCMQVLRGSVTGNFCIDTICQNVLVTCPPNPNYPGVRSFCSSNKVKNGDFREGVVPGFLDEGGSADGWYLAPNYGEGRVFVEDSIGANDEGHLKLIGGKGNIAGIFQSVDLTWDTFTVIEYNLLNYLGADIPSGTIIEFRLKEDPFPYSPSELIYREVIDSTSKAWRYRTFSPSTAFISDTAIHERYLVVSLMNNSDSANSIIGIDNISICTSGTVGTSQPKQKRKEIHIYPNPNSGNFMVELPNPATPKMGFRIIGITGQVLMEKKTEVGSEIQSIDATNLPEGLYFLQIVSNSHLVSVNKFVKQ